MRVSCTLYAESATGMTTMLAALARLRSFSKNVAVVTDEPDSFLSILKQIPIPSTNTIRVMDYHKVDDITFKSVPADWLVVCEGSAACEWVRDLRPPNEVILAYRVRPGVLTAQMK